MVDPCFYHHSTTPPLAAIESPLCTYAMAGNIPAVTLGGALPPTEHDPFKSTGPVLQEHAMQAILLQ